MRKTAFLIGIPACVILVFFWVYFPTLTRYRELKMEQDEIEEKIANLDQKIAALTEEKELLETDKEYLEKVIRDELGLVKPGEIVYKFVQELRVPDEQSPSTDEGASLSDETKIGDRS